MSILLGVFVAWGAGTLGPFPLLAFAAPFVIVPALVSTRNIDSVTLTPSNAALLSAASLLAVLGAFLSDRLEMLWLGPVAVGALFTGRRASWTWGLALGASLMAAASAWAPSWIAGSHIQLGSDGQLLVSMNSLDAVWRRAVDLLLLAFALEGAVLLLWGRGYWFLAGFGCCVISLAGSILFFAPWVLFAAAVAVVSGYLLAPQPEDGDAGRFTALRLYLASLTALAALTLSALALAGSLGFRPSWLGRLEIPLLSAAWGWRSGVVPAVPTASSWPLSALLGLAAITILGVKTSLFGKERTRSTHQCLMRFGGCLIWALLGGSGFADPLVWWAAGCLYVQQKEEDASVLPSIYEMSIGVSRVRSDAVWIGSLLVWLFGAVLLTSSWLPEFRMWRLETGPLVGVKAAAALRKIAPERPESDYLALRNAVSAETGLPADENITLDTLKKLAMGASRLPELTPWAWIIVANAAFADGDGDEFIYAVREIMRTDTAPAVLLERCADRLRYVGAHEDALLAMEKAVAADPYNAALREKLAQRYQFTRLDNLARQQVRAARILDPMK